MAEHYDAIIVGSGAGGGTLAYELARAGKRLLVLERGGFLPRERENWDTRAVFLENRYHTTDVWTDAHGHPLHPGTGYWVGGNTKVYGAALFRLRERDFEDVVHPDGVSPAWPVKYAEFEPYYARAEVLYQVHGAAGIDPTEPPRSTPFPYEPLANEPRLQEIEDAVRKSGCTPFPVPLALMRDDREPVRSRCIRCETCDGFPCLVQAKADAEVTCIRPIMDLPNVTLRTNARVTRVLANASRTAATGVEVALEETASLATFTADVVVVSCGAINSAALLLASGLANSSDLVGRHFMMHNSSAILALTTTRNPSRFMKTFGVNDFYFGMEGYPYPMGSVQPIGSFQREMLKADAPPLTPPFVLEAMKTHAVSWWLMTEDLPDPHNRVRLEGSRVQLAYTPNNQASFAKLNDHWISVLKRAGHAGHVIDLHAYFKKSIPLEGVGHQNGTCRFGDDPRISVLDRNCRAHDLDNLYVVDSSFFPSCGAVNPTLTIVANALRVADHLLQRLGGTAAAKERP